MDSVDTHYMYIRRQLVYSIEAIKHFSIMAFKDLNSDYSFHLSGLHQLYYDKDKRSLIIQQITAWNSKF